MNLFVLFQGIPEYIVYFSPSGIQFTVDDLKAVGYPLESIKVNKCNFVLDFLATLFTFHFDDSRALRIELFYMQSNRVLGRKS